MEPLDVLEARRKWKAAQDGFPALCLDEPRLAAGIQWFHPQLRVAQQLESREGWWGRRPLIYSIYRNCCYPVPVSLGQSFAPAREREGRCGARGCGRSQFGQKAEHGRVERLRVLHVRHMAGAGQDHQARAANPGCERI